MRVFWILPMGTKVIFMNNLFLIGTLIIALRLISTPAVLIRPYFALLTSSYEWRSLAMLAIKWSSFYAAVLGLKFLSPMSKFCNARFCTTQRRLTSITDNLRTTRFQSIAKSPSLLYFQLAFPLFTLSDCLWDSQNFPQNFFRSNKDNLGESNPFLRIWSFIY
jgi:hypothetical protein